ncbi:MAG: DUF6798 domain-containing protein [Chitinophagales bacterium]
MQNNKPSLWFALFAWGAIILRWGYHYGTGDQVELLPYTLFLHDHSLYAKDFFIQGLNASIPNERTVMASLLLPFLSHLEFFCFLFYALSTVALVMGLEKLARRFVENKYVAWLAVLITLVPLNDYTLGNVDLTPDTLQAGTVAVAIIVWAINLFLDKKLVWSAVLMSIATFIQLLDGLDVMMVLCAILFIELLRKGIGWKQFLTFTGLYALTAGIYLCFILLQKTASGNEAASHTLTADAFFQTLFVFRHPHHFIFQTFPWFKTLVFFSLSLIGLLFFMARSAKLFQFMLIGLLGIIAYAVIVDCFHLVAIGNFQFYKVTQWMKFFGVLGALEALRLAVFSGTRRLGEIRFEKTLLAIGTIACFACILFCRQYLPYKVPYQLFALKEEDDMIAICEKIKDVTPQDALFIQPFDNTELKFYGQRSSFVEFKANVRHKRFVGEWLYRIGLIYNVGLNSDVKGFALQQLADKTFYSLGAAKLEELKGLGVTHLLTRKEAKPPIGELILANDTYAVYKL